MVKYVIKRVCMALITILLVASATFFLMHAIPGNPWLSDKSPSPEVIAALNEKHGLDKPKIVQLGIYLKDALHGDLGSSIKMSKGLPVIDIIKTTFPISAKIGIISLTWAVLVGVTLGSIAAYNRGKVLDSLLRIICTMGVSMPSFVVANLLMFAFCGGLAAIFPHQFDTGTWQSYILPCFSLGFYPMCYMARQARAAMLDSLGQEYIKTARAKGLKTGKIIFKHALRNALIPVLTYLGPQIAFTLCGGFVVEKVFGIPGLGRYFVQAIPNRDYPIIMGTTIFLATFVILMNLVVDLLYKLVDPRINLTKGGD